MDKFEIFQRVNQVEEVEKYLKQEKIRLTDFLASVAPTTVKQDGRYFPVDKVLELVRQHDQKKVNKLMEPLDGAK